jgi:MPBQ/MSBQ methyltransferase
MNLADRYDSLAFDPAIREFYTDNFYNAGWWEPETRTMRQAAIALVHRVLSPAEQSAPQHILDVGCGLGGGTCEIARTWPDADVIGIGISDRQIEYCRSQSNNRFLTMSATEMTFPANTFDLVVSIEAALHFEPRTSFFAEAYRVLRHGGTLAMSDMLIRSENWSGSTSVPAINLGVTPMLYAEQLRSAGFSNVAVSDVTAQCWAPWVQRLHMFVNELPSERDDVSRWRRIAASLADDRQVTYILASGVRAN